MQSNSHPLLLLLQGRMTSIIILLPKVESHVQQYNYGSRMPQSRGRGMRVALRQNPRATVQLEIVESRHSKSRP